MENGNKKLSNLLKGGIIAVILTLLVCIVDIILILSGISIENYRSNLLTILIIILGIITVGSYFLMQFFRHFNKMLQLFPDDKISQLSFIENSVKQAENLVVEMKDISDNLAVAITDRIKKENEIKELQEHLEDMMIQGEKVLSIGTLAAGMAHEINNPLSGILQSAENIIRRIQPDFAENQRVAKEVGLDLNKLNAYLKQRDIIEFVHGIRESGQRASKIVQTMLKFSKHSIPESVKCDVVELIDRIITLASMDYDLKRHYDFRKVKITKTYDSQAKILTCVPTEIEQVILNILKNAAHALFIKGEELAEQNLQHSPEINISTYLEGDMIVIKIKDNGPGITKDVQKHIFDPFFTTKKKEGTGLGMSVSKLIITKNHHGSLIVESEEGQGCTFVIRLPKNITT